MIDLYTWRTPNGYKISVMLEELQLPYQVHTINITKGEQFKPEFLKISPNNKIPAIVDHETTDGNALSIFESGAILIYLAEKTGQFFSEDVKKRSEILQWLMFQMAGFGPMLGQAHHFRRFAPEKIPYAIERYTNEAHRLYGVLEHHLAQRDYLAGDYSIADIALYPWATYHEWQGVDLKDFPNVTRWMNLIALRPAVKKGMRIPA